MAAVAAGPDSARLFSASFGRICVSRSGGRAPGGKNAFQGEGSRKEDFMPHAPAGRVRRATRCRRGRCTVGREELGAGGATGVVVRDDASTMVMVRRVAAGAVASAVRSRRGAAVHPLLASQAGLLAIMVKREMQNRLRRHAPGVEEKLRPDEMLPETHDFRRPSRVRRVGASRRIICPESGDANSDSDVRLSSRCSAVANERGHTGDRGEAHWTLSMSGKWG